MILKNETLASLVAIRDNNINSINDLMTTKVKAFVFGKSFYNDLIKKQIKNYQNKFQLINHQNIYSEQTLIKILQGTHALIHDENKLNHYYMINYKYPLHLSKSRMYLFLRGFIMKKSIDKKIEDKMKKA